MEDVEGLIKIIEQSQSLEEQMAIIQILAATKNLRALKYLQHISCVIPNQIRREEGGLSIGGDFYGSSLYSFSCPNAPAPLRSRLSFERSIGDMDCLPEYSYTEFGEIIQGIIEKLHEDLRETS